VAGVKATWFGCLDRFEVGAGLFPKSGTVGRLRIDRSLQGTLFESQRLEFDVVAGANPLVKSEGSDARQGMPDLNPTVSGAAA
jgi:hypothetical protein